MSLVSVNNLVRYYGKHCAVDHIRFELNTGDILGFLGPNGAGKSTTMQMLCGTLAPSGGEISIDGIDLLDEPRAAKRELGYLPETPPLYRDMTVREYLSYCARLHRVPGTKLGPAVDTAIQRCGLGDTGRRLIGNLSKGYQQRVGIAQAIVHTPRVIVLDEPTVGLDPIQVRQIRELIRELGAEHGIILSTHILPEVQVVCNRVQIINEGRLVFESGMDELAGTGDEYRVGFAGDVSTKRLEALVSVSAASREDDEYIVTLNAGADDFATEAVSSGLKLLKLMPREQSLEQIFVRLAHEDAPRSDAGETA